MTAPRLSLHLAGDTGPEPEQTAPAPQAEPEPEDPPAGVVAVTLHGDRMPIRSQAGAAAGHAFRAARLRARDMARRPGGPVNALLEGKPPSVAEQGDYARSRAWVPPGHQGGLADRLGVIYHLLIGRPGVALGNSVSAVASRPLRFGLFLLTVLIVTVLAVCLS